MQDSKPKLNLSDFDFTLPKELIAQYPKDKRDHSDLLVVDKDELIKKSFYNIINDLQSGDLMIFNNSRVIKAKLILNKNGKNIEIYLNKKLANGNWHGFARPARKISEGDELDIAGHKIIIAKKLEMGQIEIYFKLNNQTVFEFLDQFGEIPLPPYIKRDNINTVLDQVLYQTIYNKTPGSVAAPTAGLHFTHELLEKIRRKNIQIEYVTLHVGAGTFLPVKTEDLEQHKMHSECYHISAQTADNINNALAAKRRIIAVGTTTLRTIESSYTNGRLSSGEFETSIFIKPGFKFNVADMLLTNFHLPKSTLFILTCAFAGYANMKAAYNYAIANKMRFFSYGDAMLLKRIE